MSTERLRRYKELLVRVDEVLHYVWDPIGVAGAPGARDEYGSYAPKVVGLLRGGASTAELVAHLEQLATEQMGVSPDRARTRAAADALVGWRAALEHERP